MLDLLANFVEIVEAGTVTRAAELTGLPKSTLSRGLSSLEAHLRVRLVQRTPRALKLTAEGERLYQNCSSTLRLLQSSLSETADGAHILRGRIRIAAPATFGRIFVAPLISTMLNQYPSLEIEAVFSDKRVNLVDAGIDLAFRMGELTDSSLVARTLTIAPRVLAASPLYIAKYGAPLSPSDLPSHRIGLASREFQSMHFNHVSEGSSRVEVHAVYIAEPEALYDSVRSGAVIAPLPWFLAEKGFSDGTLLEVVKPWTLPDARVQVVYPSARGLSPAVRTLVDMATIQMSQNPAWHGLLRRDEAGKHGLAASQ